MQLKVFRSNRRTGKGYSARLWTPLRSFRERQTLLAAPYLGRSYRRPSFTSDRLAYRADVCADFRPVSKPKKSSNDH